MANLIGTIILIALATVCFAVGNVFLADGFEQMQKSYYLNEGAGSFVSISKKRTENNEEYIFENNVGKKHSIIIPVNSENKDNIKLVINKNADINYYQFDYMQNAKLKYNEEYNNKIYIKINQNTKIKEL